MAVSVVEVRNMYEWIVKAIEDLAKEAREIADAEPETEVVESHPYGDGTAEEIFYETTDTADTFNDLAQDLEDTAEIYRERLGL